MSFGELDLVKLDSGKLEVEKLEVELLAVTQVFCQFPAALRRKLCY